MGAFFFAGERQLIVRPGKEGESVILELWRGGRLVKELHVPKDLHGNIYNDNWFSIEPAWNAEETCIAYVAEVQMLPFPSQFCVIPGMLGLFRPPP